MNTRLLLAILSVVALASCSTAYKAQTPDDVYYSPAKPQDEYVQVETQKERESYRTEEYYAPDDRYLRWKVRNRNRWSTFDDYSSNDFYYGQSVYAYNRPWGNYWNSYWSWNNYYNPYCNRVIVINPKTNTLVYNKIRSYTPGTYNNTSYNNNNNRNTKLNQGSYRPTGTYNNSNSNSLGNSLKKVFSNGNSNNSNSERPVRTYTPSTPSSNSNSNSGSSNSSSGSSGSGGSGGGGGTTRPNRGG